MDVVRHHTELDYGDVMPLRDVAQHIMVYILAYAMATANKIHNLCPGQVLQSARASGRALSSTW